MEYQEAQPQSQIEFNVLFMSEFAYKINQNQQTYVTYNCVINCYLLMKDRTLPSTVSRLKSLICSFRSMTCCLWAAMVIGTPSEPDCLDKWDFHAFADNVGRLWFNISMSPAFLPNADDDLRPCLSYDSPEARLSIGINCLWRLNELWLRTRRVPFSWRLSRLRYPALALISFFVSLEVSDIHEDVQVLTDSLSDTLSASASWSLRVVTNVAARRTGLLSGRIDAGSPEARDVASLSDCRVSCSAADCGLLNRRLFRLTTRSPYMKHGPSSFLTYSSSESGARPSGLWPLHELI